MRQRILKALRSWMAAKGLDGILVTSPHNRFYLSGFLAEDMGIEESAGALLVLRRQHLLLTDGRYREQAEREAPGWHVIVYKNLAQGVREAVEGLGIGSLAYEPRFLSCAAMRSLEKALPGVRWIDSKGFLDGKRAVKSDAEVEAIREAIAVAEEVMEEAGKRVVPGVIERELAAWIVQELSVRSQGPSFPPIVASGPNAALPHAVPGSRTVAPGDPVIIDLGARVRGYCSDMTRTFFAGGPGGRMAEVYRVVREAQVAAIEACVPGATGRAVDRAARQVIAEAGLGEFFVHATGHGVGIAVHEAPSLSKRWRRALRPGMVVTVEPGVYLPGEGGVRLEAMVLVTDEGPVELTGQGGYLQW